MIEPNIFKKTSIKVVSCQFGEGWFFGSKNKKIKNRKKKIKKQYYL